MAHADAQQIDDGRPAGAVLGQSASDLVGFHGVDPTDQSATCSALSTTAAITVSGTAVYGFATAAQADAIATGYNLIRACLREKGLMA